MRAKLYFLAIVLLYAGLSHATLGGPPESFSSEDMKAVSSATSTVSHYRLRDTTLVTGTHVREYIAANGTVFAIAWEGPTLPNLKALLGKHFDALVAESRRAPKAGRGPMVINRSDVVIQSGGRMRAFEGAAWIPGELPIGFSTDNVR